MENNKKIYENYGIKGSELIDLQRFNIIIGKNGAGKTRLLKALREILSSEGLTTIYAYFPDMQAKFGTEVTEEFDMPFYESMFEEGEVELHNFVRYLEGQSYEFLMDLLSDISRNASYKNSVRKGRAKLVQSDLDAILEVLINRRLIFEKDIYIESLIDKKRYLLEQELKRMSPGELSLFYLGILLIYIMQSERKNKELILLLDEPELHLHPKALIKFLDYIKESKVITKCCIATHSMFLVPLFKFYEVIYIENGEIQVHNSKLYKSIFENVLGENEEIRDFLISIDVWQYYQFIAECFVLPTTVSKVNSQDEQFLKFIKYLKIFEISGKHINVLDYGAGAGRLGKAIHDMQRSQDDIHRVVRYFYYDKYAVKPEDLECKAFANVEEIQKSNQKFHCVILMNVLHEMDVRDWYESLNEIREMLESDGYLLIFEVHALLHGEQPYGNNGYILLGENEMKTMFASNQIKEIELNKKDKTSLFVIPNYLIYNITEESILNALKTLGGRLYRELQVKYNSKREIALKGEKVSRNMVKDYAFLSQHYINSLFAVEELEIEKRLI